MIKLYKLEISEEQLENLPIFYNFITYNEMMKDPENSKMFRYIEAADSNVFYYMPMKPISEIIDFTKR